MSIEYSIREIYKGIRKNAAKLVLPAAILLYEPGCVNTFALTFVKGTQETYKKADDEMSLQTPAETYKPVDCDATRK